MDAQQLAAVGTVLGSAARAEIVCALMGGTAHTGTELARHCGIAPSTASEHLGVLVDAGLVVVEPQGRHRYFRLRGHEVAEAVEHLGTAMPMTTDAPARPALPSALAHARSCYDHLAGQLGVQLHDHLVTEGCVSSTVDGAAMTERGWRWLDDAGIAHVPTTRPAVRRCVDWSERRTHLGGSVGAALLDHMLSERWLRRGARQHRVLELTNTGRRGFAGLGLEV